MSPRRNGTPLRSVSWLTRNQHLSYDPTAGDDLTITGQPQRLPVAYSTTELSHRPGRSHRRTTTRLKSFAGRPATRAMHATKRLRLTLLGFSSPTRVALQVDDQSPFVVLDFGTCDPIRVDAAARRYI